MIRNRGTKTRKHLDFVEFMLMTNVILDRYILFGKIDSRHTRIKRHELKDSDINSHFPVLMISSCSNFQSFADDDLRMSRNELFMFILLYTFISTINHV